MIAAELDPGTGPNAPLRIGHGQAVDREDGVGMPPSPKVYTPSPRTGAAARKEYALFRSMNLWSRDRRP